MRGIGQRVSYSSSLLPPSLSCLYLTITSLLSSTLLDFTNPGPHLHLTSTQSHPPHQPNSTQLLVSGAPSGAVTLQPLALRSPGTLPPPPPQLQSKDNQTNQDYHHQHQQQQQEVVRFVDATSPVTVVSLLLKHSSSCPPSFSNNSNSDNNSQNYDDAIDPASSSSLSSHISSSATDPAIANTSSSSSSTTTSSSSIFRGLYVAAGCEDGTVGVWDTDHLPLTSPSLPSSSTEGPGLGLGKGDRSCLFCHQLRPTERLMTFLDSVL